MVTPALLEGLRELYQGEVLGEVIFDRLLPKAENDDQRYKLAIMLQLETETKARLRPLAMRWGLPLSEDPVERGKAERAAQAMSDMPWTEKIRAIHNDLDQNFVPRYIEIAALADALDDDEDADIIRSRVTHERALHELTRREISGEAHRAAEPVEKLLRYPLEHPAAKAG